MKHVPPAIAIIYLCISSLLAKCSNSYSYPSLRRATQSRRAVLSYSSAALLLLPRPAQARLEPVDKPELLPAEKGVKVIQTGISVLTKGQEKRLTGM